MLNINPGHVCAFMCMLKESILQWGCCLGDECTHGRHIACYFLQRNNIHDLYNYVCISYNIQTLFEIITIVHRGTFSLYFDTLDCNL